MSLIEHPTSDQCLCCFPTEAWLSPGSNVTLVAMRSVARQEGFGRTAGRRKWSTNTMTLRAIVGTTVNKIKWE